MPGLPLRPIITYGVPSKIIDLSMPQKWWGYKTQLVGGSRKSSAGIPESFVIREDNLSMVSLRVHECELLDVRAWIVDFWRRNQPFIFQYDALDTLTKFTAYLDAPTFDDGWEPRRMANPNFPQFWEVDVTIRNVEQVPIFVSVTGDCASTSVFEQAWILANFANGENFRLSVGPTPATFGSNLNLANFPELIDADSTFYRSSAPEGIWDTLILTSGVIIPDYVTMESMGPTADMAWLRMGSNFTLQQIRDSDVIAEITSPDYGSSSLVTGFVNYDVSGIGPLYTEENDIIRLILNGYLQKKAGVPDDGWRNPYYYGAVFGPRQNPRLICLANVEEIP